MPIIKKDRASVWVRGTANTSLIANNAHYYRPLTGTVSQNTSSNNIIGVGTSFTTDFQTGDYIGYLGGGGYRIKIHSISSATAMVGTSRPANNVSGAAYGISEPRNPTKGFVIDDIYWSGNWTVKRGANTVAILSGSDHWSDLGLDEYRGASLVLQNLASGGTIIVKTKKTFS